MAFILQSTAEPTRYWTGTTLKTRRTKFPDWGMFTTDIDQAREFDTRGEAGEHADTIQVPTTIVEV